MGRTTCVCTRGKSPTNAACVASGSHSKATETGTRKGRFASVLMWRTKKKNWTTNRVYCSTRIQTKTDTWQAQVTLTDPTQSYDKPRNRSDCTCTSSVHIPDVLGVPSA